MRILLISYGIKEYDGRLKELLDVSNNLGDVTCVCIGEKPSKDNSEKIVKLSDFKYLSLFSYISFIKLALKTAHEISDIDILVSDNFFAAIPSLIISLFYKPKKVIQDVRELYFYKEMKNLSEKILCYFEKTLMKRSDVILCANEYRSKIMYEYYKLNKYPIVFENIRFLTGDYDKELLDTKYKNSFNNKINVVSTGGLSVKRNTDKLVQAMSKLPNDYVLFVIGGGTRDDENIISRIIQENNISNVKFISKVALSELRYIVQKCDIGIVNYHSNDLNNQYCASGKIYEYLELGLPVVCTENMPLKDFCEKYNVGIADNKFNEGIEKVAFNLKKFRECVNEFMKDVSVKDYNKSISSKILDELGVKVYK